MLTKCPNLTVNLLSERDCKIEGFQQDGIVVLCLKIQAMRVKFNKTAHQEQPKITTLLPPQSFCAGHLTFNCSKGSVPVTSSRSLWITESTKQQMSLDSSISAKIADRSATDF